MDVLYSTFNFCVLVQNCTYQHYSMFVNKQSRKLVHKIYVRLVKLTEAGVLNVVKEKHFNIDLSKCSTRNLQTESVKLQVKFFD